MTSTEDDPPAGSGSPGANVSGGQAVPEIRTPEEAALVADLIRAHAGDPEAARRILEAVPLLQAATVTTPSVRDGGGFLGGMDAETIWEKLQEGAGHRIPAPEAGGTDPAWLGDLEVYVDAVARLAALGISAAEAFPTPGNRIDLTGEAGDAGAWPGYGPRVRSVIVRLEEGLGVTVYAGGVPVLDLMSGPEEA